MTLTMFSRPLLYCPCPNICGMIRSPRHLMSGQISKTPLRSSTFFKCQTGAESLRFPVDNSIDKVPLVVPWGLDTGQA